MKKYLIDYERRLTQELALLKSCETSAKNKSLILDFKDFNSLNSVSLPRIIRQLGSLRLVAVKLNKDFRTATRKDFEKLILYLQGCKYTDETIDTHKKIIKVFYRWLNKGEYPDSVKWIKAVHGKSTKLPEDLLTEEEVKQLIDAKEFKRDKAFIASLWESGARIGELGTLSLKNVVFDDFGCQILVDGKTGMRRIRLVNAAPYLLEWLNQHPEKNNPNAPLWMNFDCNLGHATSQANFKKILRSAAKKAKIPKPVNPHHFRHSRATYMAQFLTEAQLKEYFGWTQNSAMASRYVHLSGKQVDDAILRMNGLKKDEITEPLLKRKPCPRCKALNDVSNQLCEKCWLPLSLEGINRLEEKQKQNQQALVSIMRLVDEAKSNPGFLEEMLKQAREVNTRNMTANSTPSRVGVP